ncbi:hypothetical protein [Rhizobium changzhiense]|uniref:RiboL-PSP-HEPN domain-containing protein n=1 Tax=Rhizobium changzhiense TaxID=2692317 RepID=A0ABR6AGC8_9HYPH|nr:hypothetical protein [Rhizobium changzhiense]MBA5805704.1 hypothetical protein [Rhizobium changzhiense]
MDNDVHKFSYCGIWVRNNDYEARLDTALVPRLREDAEIFKENIMRVRNLGALLPEVAYWIHIGSRINSVATANIGRKIELPGRVCGAPPADQALIDERLRQYEAWPKIPADQAWQDGCDLVRSIVDLAPQHHGLGLQALLGAMLQETWSAFEGGLIETWTTAVNLSPDPLGKNMLAGDKTLAVSQLERYAFNVSNNLGDILKDSPGKVDLASFSGIKKAYSTAFAKELDTSEIFAQFDPLLSHFEAVRHLLAHRAGRVDTRFLRRVQNSPNLKDFEVGQMLALDGEMVSEFTKAAVECFVQVHVAVDRFVSKAIAD